jgi:hypothetical protein
MTMSRSGEYRGSNLAMPMIMDFRFMRRIWALAVLTASDRNRGHDVYPGSGPWRVTPTSFLSDLVLLK